MEFVKVKNQAELDAALAAGNFPICIDGQFVVTGSATVEAWGSATVEAWGSATVRAWDSATVEAWDSATVRASGSATVRASDSATVEASGSATVEASGSATVRASGSATVRASGHVMVRAIGKAIITATAAVVIMTHGVSCSVTGGIQVAAKQPTTAQEWCELNGVEVKDGKCVLYKAVDDDFRSHWKADYSPGTIPVAQDWDGGKEECGGGLHFCPSPIQARSFFDSATRYVACPVALVDMRPPKDTDSHPSKTKARGCCDPVWECDIDGNPIQAKELIAQ